MTQPSAILIAPTVPLRALPDAERDVLRRFFTEHVKGMDSASDKRWRRFIGQLFRAEPGEGFELVRLEHRNLPFHARHRAILERLFQSQERYQLIDAMHDWLKLKTYFVTWGEGRRGNPIPIPRSTAFFPYFFLIVRSASCIRRSRSRFFCSSFSFASFFA